MSTMEAIKQNKQMYEELFERRLLGLIELPEFEALESDLERNSVRLRKEAGIDMTQAVYCVQCRNYVEFNEQFDGTCKLAFTKCSDHIYRKVLGNYDGE